MLKHSQMSTTEPMGCPLNRPIHPFRRLLWEAVGVTERYLTNGEAAEKIGIAASTLRAAAKSGRLKPAMVTPGGHYRWDLDDLRRQLERLREGTSKEHFD